MVKIPEMPELTFEESTHTYRLDGQEIPSVTTVMGPLSAAKYRTVNRSTLDRAASRGTAVHSAIEMWINYGIEDYSPELSGYFQGFMDWWNRYRPEPVGTEVKLYHKLLRYAGTADLIAYIDGELTLVDFKTTTTIIDMTCSVQLEAYAQALKSHGIAVEGKRILQLKKDGGYAERLYPASDAARWKVFGCLKTVYEYIQNNMK